MFDDIGKSVTKPFKEQMPLSNLLLYIGLFLVLAWIAYDMLRILSSWMANASPQ